MSKKTEQRKKELIYQAAAIIYAGYRASGKEYLMPFSTAVKDAVELYEQVDKIKFF